jgi:hypothetical protein
MINPASMDVFMWNGLFCFFFFATFVYPSHHELCELQYGEHYHLYQTSIIMPSTRTRRSYSLNHVSETCGSSAF